MNSAGAENSQGALTNGTSDNLRWEISSPNTSSGTFSVLLDKVMILQEQNQFLKALIMYH